MPTEHCQLSHMTRAERFPKIFDSAVELAPNARRILSFGCSTGEEAQALAVRFPDSEVVGVDIDHYYSVQTARRNNKFPDRVFYHDDLGGTGKYDLCTCLMVLFMMDNPIPFERVESTVEQIDRHLNPGAVLMLYTTEHPFEQTKVFKGYSTIRSWKRKHNKNGKTYFNGYFRKHGQVLAQPSRKWFPWLYSK